MEEKKKNSKISLIITVVLIVFLFISVCGVTYAAYLFSKKGIQKNTVSTGTLTFTYTESTNGISLINAMPISDEVGKKQITDGNNGYFDFNINYETSQNKAVSYEIYAELIPVDNQLSSDYVKIYLTDADTEQPLSNYTEEIVPTFSSLKNSTINSNAKRLYGGSFYNSGSKNYRLRMWLSDEYNVDTISKQFKIKVNVFASE